MRSFQRWTAVSWKSWKKRVQRRFYHRDHHAKNCEAFVSSNARFFLLACQRRASCQSRPIDFGRYFQKLEKSRGS